MPLQLGDDQVSGRFFSPGAQKAGLQVQRTADVDVQRAAINSLECLVPTVILLSIYVHACHTKIAECFCHTQSY